MTPSQDNPLPIAYLTTARLGEKGQITVPKAGIEQVQTAKKPFTLR